jgi:hypothetical protein
LELAGFAAHDNMKWTIRYNEYLNKLFPSVFFAPVCGVLPNIQAVSQVVINKTAFFKAKNSINKMFYTEKIKE